MPPPAPTRGSRGLLVSPVSPSPPSWWPLSPPGRPPRTFPARKTPRPRSQPRVCAGHRPSIPRLALPRHVPSSPSQGYPCPVSGGFDAMGAWSGPRVGRSAYLRARGPGGGLDGWADIAGGLFPRSGVKDVRSGRAYGHAMGLSLRSVA